MLCVKVLEATIASQIYARNISSQHKEDSNILSLPHHFKTQTSSQLSH